MSEDVIRGAAIAKINDAYRRTSPSMMVSRGVCGLDVNKIIQAIREFDDFNKDNDPYGEHDFFAITVGSDKLFWKMDYYNRYLKHGFDPLDPNCRRVMTVMLAEEY